MVKELETKILEINPVQVRKILRENHADFVKKVFQQNFMYGNDYTRKKGIAVRIRKEGRNVILGVKGKIVISGGHKTREETETAVSDFETVEKILLSLGLQNTALREMKREYWKLFGCSVEICDMPKIPTYLELEGSPRAILRVAHLLGYSPKDYYPGFTPDYYGIKEKFLRFKR